MIPFLVKSPVVSLQNLNWVKLYSSDQLETVLTAVETDDRDLNRCHQHSYPHVPAILPEKKQLVRAYSLLSLYLTVYECEERELP